MIGCIVVCSVFICLFACFIDGGNRRIRIKPPTCRKSLTNFITQFCIEYNSSWARFEFTTLVVIGPDFSGSCKSNYHTIKIMMTSIEIFHYTRIYYNTLLLLEMDKNYQQWFHDDLLWRAVKIVSYISSNWWVVERPGIKPHWNLYGSLFYVNG